MSAPYELKDYEHLEDSDNWTYSVVVPDWNEETRARATDAITAVLEGWNSQDGEAHAAISRQLAEKANKHTSREHLTDPGDDSCGCEGPGWWCGFGDGEQRKFWFFEGSDIEAATDQVHALEDDERFTEGGAAA